MKVASSSFLLERKPVMQELLSSLLEEYAYASILGQDSYSKNYRVSGQGSLVTQDELLTKRGFVIRVMDEKGYGEYACTDVSWETLPAIRKAIKEGLTELSNLPEGVSFMEKGVPQDEPALFGTAAEYEIHPAQLGDEAILVRLTALREKGKAVDPRIMDFSAFAAYQEIHKLFLSRRRDLMQDLLWTCGTLVALARRGQEIKDAYKGFSAAGGAEVLERM